MESEPTLTELYQLAENIYSKSGEEIIGRLIIQSYGGLEDYKSCSPGDLLKNFILLKLVDKLLYEHEVEMYYESLIEMPLEELPAEVGNASRVASKLIEWRFKIGK
jgi:hypothetical protein